MIYARALTLDNSRLRLIVLADQLFNVRQFFVQVLEAIFGPLMLEILFHFVVFPNYSFLYLLEKIVKQHFRRLVIQTYFESGTVLSLLLQFGFQLDEPFRHFVHDRIKTFVFAVISVEIRLVRPLLVGGGNFHILPKKHYIK